MYELSLKTPQSIAEACQMLVESGGKLIAGGTDVIPQMRNGRFQANTLIDISRLTDLNTIEEKGKVIAIGALTNYTTLRHSPLLQETVPMLVEVAGLVGGVQTQNRGSIGGNIANASPAGDTLPPLLALDAEVVLQSINGKRVLPLAEFLQGPGQTAIAPNELLRQVQFPRPAAGTKSTFMRLGNRRGMVISVVSAAIVLLLDGENRVEDVRIALGAAAPTPIRCPAAESLLHGQVLTEKLIEKAAETAVAASSPIDDVRGTAAYRRHGVKVLVRRGLQTLAGLR
ncbi:MAG: hypothetical protein CSA11_06710 [Chloroflexi bacterium]|nr:MAG: hypothetical protein CSB13_03310 [Chloroflexota bacterium]PIE80737.1 MAG: hypothetical protein CSA11_06710 [Chloroflexota bacterium]